MNDLFGKIKIKRLLNPALGQFMTPLWAADALVEEFYPELDSSDIVIEPSCGDGAFLQAIPDHVPAIGVEIDQRLASEAIVNTGRKIITGDFRTVDIPEKPTLIIGNPPFKSSLIDEFLIRSAQLMTDGGRVGFLLPTYAIQTPSTVLRWNETWSLDQRLIPRTLFPRAIRPLVFLMFTKDKHRRMLGGFALYRAAYEINSMREEIKALLIQGEPRKPVWRSVVEFAMKRLGGTCHLKDLYSYIEPIRPSENPWWKAKVRQTLQRYFTPVDRGMWSLKPA